MFWLKKWLGGLLMPLPFTLALIVLGLLLLWFTRRQRLGKTMCTLGALLLIAFSLRPVSVDLLRPLEQQYPPFPIGQSVDFILVLGHGHVSDPTVPLTSQPISNAYARILEAIDIKRRNPQAKLVLSGNISSDPISCAEMYARIAEHYGVSRRDMILIEDAYDTHDEVTRYRSIIGDHTAALVTSASHMPRAMGLIRQAGLHVIPAPTDYLGRQAQRPIPSYGYLPEGRYLMYSETALHEWIGAIWSQLRNQSKE
jgi:uncharacterized SAM-binding protein YcdF (DUF218 family)